MLRYMVYSVNVLIMLVNLAVLFCVISYFGCAFSIWC